MAAPIFLDNRNVDEAGRRELERLAEISGLSEDELDSVIRRLHDQGIVGIRYEHAGAADSREDILWLDNEPESAHGLAADMIRARAASLLSRSGLDDQGRAELVEEACGLGLEAGEAMELVESMIPPALPPRVPPAPRLEQASAAAAPASTAEVAFVEPVDQTDNATHRAGDGAVPVEEIEWLDAPAPPPLPQRRDAPAASREARRERLREQVVQILQLHRCIDSRAHAMLVSQCQQLDLEREDLDQILQDLMGRPSGSEPYLLEPEPPPLPGDSPAGSAATDSIRIDDEATVPAPPQRSPQESYRHYLNKAIPQLRRERISLRSERKLIAEGVRKLGISEALGQQLLQETADELGVPMVSRQAGLPVDPRIAKFVERAGPILAEQRGINATTRMLLAALGDELQLDQEQVDRAMQQLTGNEDSNGLERAKLEAFRVYALRVLSSLESAAITCPLEEQLLLDGVERHGVSRGEAASAVHEAARQLGIHVIRREQASRHVAARIAQRMADQERDLAGDDPALLAEARLWGLSEDELRELIHQQLAQRHRKRKRERLVTGVALLLSSVAVLALVAGTAMFWLPGFDSSAREPAVSDADSSASPTSDAAGPAAGAAPWWDEDLQIAVTKARVLLWEEDKALLAGVLDNDDAQRAAAYGRLAQRFPKAADERTVRESLSGVIAGCFACDPNQDNARQLLTDLLGVIPHSGDPLPDSPDDYPRMFRAMSVAVEALTRESAPEERVRWLGQQLSDRLGVRVPLEPLAEVDSLCMRQLSVLLYRNLIAAAAAHEGSLEPHYWELSGILLARVTDEDLRNQLELEFLEAVLLAGQESWRPYEQLITRHVYGDDALQVLRMVDVMERTEDESLRELLAERLLFRIEEPPGELPAEQVAGMVRAALGAGPDTRRLDSSRREFLSAAGQAAKEHADGGQDELAADIVALAYASTQGCALAAGALGEPDFEALRSDGAPRLTPPPAPASRAAPRRAPGGGDPADAVTPSVRRLTRAARGRLRLQVMNDIVSRVSSAPDIKYEDAQVLAAYLLRPKSDEEHQQALTFAGMLAAWPAVRLAVADRLAEKHESRYEDVHQIVQALVGSSIEVKEGEDWSQRLQGELLARALGALGGASGRAVDGGLAEQAGQHLLNLYRTQAKVRGVPLAKYSTATSCGAMLKLLIDGAAERIEAGALSREQDRQFLADLPYELLAVEHVAGHDIDETAMLQRLWLRVLAIELSAAHEGAASEADRVVSELAALDSRADNVLHQIRDGELQLLRMWRLYVKEVSS